MPRWSNTGDFTTNNLPNLGEAGNNAYRVVNGVNTYLPGTVLQLAPIDSQIYPDFQTVQPSPAAASGSKIVGVVVTGWAGFDNMGQVIDGVPTPLSSYQSPIQSASQRGTVFVQARVKGINYVLVDVSAGVTITDGIPLVTSANTAGYAQGVAKSTAETGCLVGVANLPTSTSLPGYTLTTGSLGQASTYETIATPAAGDVLNLTIQTPYTDFAPGVLQTTTWSSPPLTSGQAATATTAALAMLTFLNAQPSYSKWFIATQSAGEVITTVNAHSVPWLVTGGSTSSSGTLAESYRYYISLSGVTANLLTVAASVTGSGGTTFTAHEATFGADTAGTGYLGICPALINGEF